MKVDWQAKESESALPLCEGQHDGKLRISLSDSRCVQSRWSIELEQVVCLEEVVILAVLGAAVSS